MDRNIQIEIKDRIAHLVGNPKIICGNNDYSVTFAFDDEWAGVDIKTLRVSYNNKYSDHVFTGDTVELPPIIKAVEVYLGVFAGDITSTRVAVRAEPSILCSGGSVADPEPDVYKQIVDLVNAGRLKGDPGEDGAPGQKGDKGDPGTDATVTAENIASALGYTPANAQVVGDLSEEMVAQRAECTGSRLTSLDNTHLSGFKIYETVGIPVYVSNVTDYSAYAITETGWYLFVRIEAKTDAAVTAETTITGAAGYIATPGAAHVDVAVRFDVAAQSQIVTITWSSGNAETFVFKATDLAVRNLDYRTTFYVYDISEHAEWKFKAATDATAVGTAYYIQKNGVYTKAAVKAHEIIPANTYYTFADGQYTLATDPIFKGTAYFAKSDGIYTQVAVAAGEAISGYYVHSGVTFSGMARNVTYKCDTVIDCPVTFILPEIEDEIHGCWYEIRFRYAAYFSTTLQVPDGVKVATEGTLTVTEGINMVDLHYTDVGGAKVWRFVNTHSTIPGQGGDA